MTTVPVITTPPPTTGTFPAYGTGIGPFARPYQIVSVGELQRASRGTLNGAATGAGPAQATVAGLNTALPIVYGRQRVGAKITAVLVYNNNLILRCAWCIGEVDQVVGLYLNDEPLPSTCTATHYTGTTTQGVDPTLASAYSIGFGKTYTDRLAGDGLTRPGVCYSVVVIPPGVSNGFPRLVADIKGMKVRSTSGGARAWSQNPAYAIADYIESTIYGMGRSVDWATVATVAAVCAASIGSPAEARHVLDLVMAQPQSCETWLNVLREYAGCWAVPEGSSYRLVADALPTAGSAKNITAISKANPARITSSSHGLATGAVVRIASVAGMTQINSAVGVVSYVDANNFDLTGVDSSSYSTYTSGGTATQIETSAYQFGASNVLANSLRIAKRGVLNAPTVVTVSYVDTSVTPWRDGTATRYAAGVLAGTTPRRESRVAMPGLTRYSEAYRAATERLNYAQLGDLTCTFTAFDVAVRLQVGDLIDITHPAGLSAKICRIAKLDPIDPGRWSITAVEWDPDVYSTDVVAGPGIQDTTLPSPTSPPVLTGLTLTEEVYQVETGRFASRIRATWTAPTYPFVASYAVSVTYGGSVVDSAIVPVGTTAYVTPALAENTTYQVAVSIVSTLNVLGTAATATVLLNGKAAIPSDVPAFSGYELGGEVRLSWTSATDLDLTAHEIRYSTTGGSWAAATLLDRVAAPAVSYTTKRVPPGAWRFWIKALDSVRTLAYPYGQESANAISVDITVTSDLNAFVAGTYSFATPTLVDMVATTGGWISDRGDTWNTLFTSTLSTYTNALASYTVTTGESGLYTEPNDFGSSLTGDWAGDMTYSNVSGTAVLYMQLNNAGGEASKSVSGATNATPIVITTSAAHGYASGDEVVIAGVGGNTAANGRWKITVTSSTQFSLQTFAGDNVAGNGAYTSGGTSVRWIWQEYPAEIVRTTARYGRLRIATTGSVYVTSLGTLYCSVVARSEAIPGGGGTVTTNASGPYVVELAGHYNKVKAISGTLIGSTAKSWVVDKIEVSGNRGLLTGYCLRFDGSDDHVTMGDQAVHSFTTGNFSLEAWVRPDNLTNAGIVVGKSGDGTTGEYVLYVAAGGQVVANVIDNTGGGRVTFGSSVVIDANIWTHLAFAYTASGSVGQIYFDGQPVTTYKTTTGTYTQMRDTTYAFMVGRQNAGNYFVGCIDDVRLWNTARSAAQVLANYATELTGSESGLVGYWKFNDNTGTTADDLTSNAKDGTLTSGPSWRPYDGFDLYAHDASGTQLAAQWFGKFEGI